MFRKSILFFLCFPLLSACGKKSDGNAAASASDPYIGTYFLAGESASTSDIFVSTISIEPGNKITGVNMVFPGGSTSHAYFRKNVGTYAKTGDEFLVTWSYESCDPEGTESFTVTSKDPSDRIFIGSGSTIIQYLNNAKWGSDNGSANSALVLTEDTECNKFPE